VSDDFETEIFDSDCNIPITSSLKQSQSCPSVFNSENETHTEEGESIEWDSFDDKTSDMWCTTSKKTT
jgi:hypothetical protein